ncbi:MAG: hypothetical protein PXX77_08800 [Gallionella sp.]|nr:hypothetical protein [Gallionella sp.]
MLTSLHREYLQFVTTGAQLVLLLACIESQSYIGWMWGLGIMALISIFAWHSALKRLRAISGTPSSRIGSAAQGYVEIIGRGEYAVKPLYAKYSHLPCLWYRYKVEYRDRQNKWCTGDTGESTTPFTIEDESGKCVVDPRGAEIICNNKDTWKVADYRITEWKLLNTDHIYILGEFRTEGGNNLLLSHDELVKKVLAAWKTDNGDLLRRFDLDNNGQLDMQEWMLARQAAKREAEKRLNEESAEPDISFMLKPRDGRLYLISDMEPGDLEGRYKFWAWAHIVIFFAALQGIVWALQHSAN